MTPQEIIEAVRSGKIESHSFKTNEEYLEWANSE